MNYYQKKQRTTINLPKELLPWEQGRHHKIHQELLFKEQRITKTKKEREIQKQTQTTYQEKWCIENDEREQRNYIDFLKKYYIYTIKIWISYKLNIFT